MGSDQGVPNMFPDLGSYEAARLLISRLQAEVYEQEWDPDLLGVTFLLPEELVFAQTDEGVDVAVGDLLLASLSLIFALFRLAVEESDFDAEELLGLLGVGVADSAPEGV